MKLVRVSTKWACVQVSSRTVVRVSKKLLSFESVYLRVSTKTVMCVISSTKPTSSVVLKTSVIAFFSEYLQRCQLWPKVGCCDQVQSWPLWPKPESGVATKLGVLTNNESCVLWPTTRWGLWTKLRIWIVTVMV